jgi:hypothetical protein
MLELLPYHYFGSGNKIIPYLAFATIIPAITIRDIPKNVLKSGRLSPNKRPTNIAKTIFV